MRPLIVALGVLALTSLPAAAQGPGGKPTGNLDSSTRVAKELDEQLFLLYLLEHCYRDTFTPSGEPRLGDRNTLAIAVRHGNPVRAFVQDRRQQIDRVTARFRQKNVTLDADLQACFDDYAQLLSQVEALDARIERRYEEFLKPIREMYAEVDREAARKYAAAMADATRAGLTAAANAPDDDAAVGRGLAAFVFVGAIRGEQVRRDRQANFRAAMAKEKQYRDRETPRLLDDIARNCGDSPRSTRRNAR